MSKQEEQTTLSGALVTGNFTIQATMPNGKSMNVSGYLYEGESVESVNQRVSLFQDIVDFQRTRAEIPELELKVAAAEKRLDEIKTHYAVIIKRRDAGGKLSSQEKQALEVMDVNIDKHIQDIDDGRKAVEEAKAKVAQGLK